MTSRPSFVVFRGGERAEVWRKRGDGWWCTWRAENERRLPHTGEWVPLLLRSEDRTMLEKLVRLKRADASSVVRQLIAREFSNLTEK